MKIPKNPTIADRVCLGRQAGKMAIIIEREKLYNKIWILSPTFTRQQLSPLTISQLKRMEKTIIKTEYRK